jgi:hypothetical protein
LTQRPKLNPWFFTGFCDAESSFSILVQPNNDLKTKWRVRAIFSITLHVKDKVILEDIKNFFGVGTISISKAASNVIFNVSSFKDLDIIINHFDKFPLITVKSQDFFIFKKCFNIIKQGEHLTQKGMLEILNLKSNLNRGSS